MHNACPRTTSITCSIDPQHCKTWPTYYYMHPKMCPERCVYVCDCAHVSCMLHITCTITDYNNIIIYIILHTPYKPADATQQVSHPQNPNMVHHTRTNTHTHTTIIRLTLMASYSADLVYVECTSYGLTAYNCK